MKPWQRLFEDKSPLSLRIDGKDIEIWNDVNDYRGGETFGSTYAQIGNDVLGAVDWSEYDGTVAVKMVATRPEWRRKGVATKLFDALKLEYPDAKIHYGMSTDMGTKFLDTYLKRIQK